MPSKIANSHIKTRLNDSAQTSAKKAQKQDQIQLAQNNKAEKDQEVSRVSESDKTANNIKSKGSASGLGAVSFAKESLYNGFRQNLKKKLNKALSKIKSKEKPDEFVKRLFAEARKQKDFEKAFKAIFGVKEIAGKHKSLSKGLRKAYNKLRKNEETKKHATAKTKVAKQDITIAKQDKKLVNKKASKFETDNQVAKQDTQMANQKMQLASWDAEVADTKAQTSAEIEQANKLTDQILTDLESNQLSSAKQNAAKLESYMADLPPEVVKEINTKLAGKLGKVQGGLVDAISQKISQKFDEIFADKFKDTIFADDKITKALKEAVTDGRISYQDLANYTIGDTSNESSTLINSIIIDELTKSGKLKDHQDLIKRLTESLGREPTKAELLLAMSKDPEKLRQAIGDKAFLAFDKRSVSKDNQKNIEDHTKEFDHLTAEEIRRQADRLYKKLEEATRAIRFEYLTKDEKKDIVAVLGLPSVLNNPRLKDQLEDYAKNQPEKVRDSILMHIDPKVQKRLKAALNGIYKTDADGNIIDLNKELHSDSNKVKLDRILLESSFQNMRQNDNSKPRNNNPQKSQPIKSSSPELVGQFSTTSNKSDGNKNNDWGLA